MTIILGFFDISASNYGSLRYLTTPSFISVYSYLLELSNDAERSKKITEVLVLSINEYDASTKVVYSIKILFF
jgi:hypothetical protein